MTKRDRRALLLGGAMVLTAVVVLRVLPWAAGALFAAENDLRERATLLAHARSELRDAAELKDSMAIIAQQLVGLAPKLLSGSTPPEALADLSSRLSLAASRHGAKLQRVDQLPDSTAAGRLRQLRVRTALETDVRGLTGVLRALEFGEAAMTLEEFRVSARDVNSPERTPEVLQVELTVSGWFLEAGRAVR